MGMGGAGGLGLPPLPSGGSSFGGLQGGASGLGAMPPLPSQGGGLGAMPPQGGSQSGGLGALPTLGALGGAGGLGAMPSQVGAGGLGAPLGQGSTFGGLSSSLGGGAAAGLAPGGGPPPQLPTLNLLGGAMGQPGGLGGGLGGGGDQTPQNIQQMQAQAVRDSKLDSMCPGKQRQSTDVGAECWTIIWTSGGCKAENTPKYEQWHQTQNLEVLVADVVQWANLPDDRHRNGCFGDGGPPVNEPAPPMPRQGGLGAGLGGGLGSLPGSGGGLGGGLGSLPGSGGLGLGAPPAQPQGPAPPPEVAQKIESALQSPDLPNLCPGVARQATSVGEACWKKIWTHVGCQERSTPAYEQWHDAQSMEVLVADAAQWASLPSEKHRTACYGSSPARADL